MLIQLLLISGGLPPELTVKSTVEPLLYDYPQNHIGVVV